jgi:flagellar protein FlaG
MDIRPVSNAATPASAGIDRDPASALRAGAAASASGAPVPAPAADPAAVRQPGAADALDEAVSHINKSLKAGGQGVEFSIDDDSKRLVVKVVDQETREVLRQMPSVEALEIARALDQAKGMLIRQEA